MVEELTNNQIDQLGQRLRQGPPDDSDLRLLHEHRQSFGAAYETVIAAIREHLRLEPGGRPAKTTHSIVEKLRRESIRLSQMQDIAGCRVVVEGPREQESVIESTQELFSNAKVVDRRANPSFGYRAVHIIVFVSSRCVEIQVRTALQHVWADLSEKLSDRYPGTKYGGGPEQVRRFLDETGELVGEIDDHKLATPPGFEELSRNAIPAWVMEKVAFWEAKRREFRDRLTKVLREAAPKLTALVEQGSSSAER